MKITNAPLIDPSQMQGLLWAERLTDSQVIDAIDKAREGIKKYLKLMKLFESEDVAKSKDFQGPYKGFYRVRRGTEWCEVYFGLMQECRTKSLEFADILEELRRRLGNDRCEPSFASKLVATLNPDRPVWDRYVLKNLGFKWPSPKSGNKHQYAVSLYSLMRESFELFLTTEKARRWIVLFNERVSGFERITDIKKVDFICWQNRTP